MPVFSTAAVPRSQKFEAWRHVITQQFLPLRPEPVRRARFWGEVRGGMLDSLALAQVRACGQVVHRSSSEIAQSSPDALFVNVHVSGESTLEAGILAHRLSQGDLFIVDGRRPFRLHCEAPMHHVVIAIPLDRLRASLLRPELAAGAVVRRSSGVTAVLSDYMVSVALEYQLFDAATAASTAGHLTDLVAHVLNEHHADVPLPRDAVRAALYSRACRIVEQELGDSQLAPAQIAKRLRVSVRFLHALFREHGQPVMRRIYESRLRRAAALLGDTACAHRSITEIAMSCGFSDPTHFARLFARAYQKSPRAFRNDIN